MVLFRVLGPLEAVDERGPVDLRGPRHRAVLARLLVAGGRVVPVTRLIDDLWGGDAPEGALGAVQTFVGALRKSLEPDRPPRTPSRLLVTVPPGYALRSGEVDARRFEAAVAEAARLSPQDAHALLDDALALWRGPAYAEFADLPWARAEAVRLDESRLLAVERRAEAALALGRAAEAVPELRAHVAAHPLREDGRRLLALALYRTGRQGEALAALRESREVLREELGVDPGHALRSLETDILAQAPNLTPQAVTPSAVTPSAATPPHPFVGRAEELAELDRAARTGGRLALVSGTAGAGKTALARRLADRLAAEGWRTAWGECAEDAPTAWPWTRIADALGLPDVVAATRFERHRAVAAALAGLRRPVLLVFDDVHRADEDTLALVTSLATDPDAGRVLVVATYRATEVPPALTAALGRAARAEPTRVHLGGLTAPRVRELVEALTGREPTDADVLALHARSAGNPFLVRELARLWETDPALSTVPAGVRDVIRHRLARLTPTTRTHLRQASVLGLEFDLDVLVPLAGDEDAVLDSVESALLAGFLVEQGADRLRFDHALVHEALYGDLPRARRTRWHATAADLVERVRPDDVEAVAHHLLRAGDRVDPARTARWTRAAAERAERRFAPHQAAALWRETLARPGTDRLAALTGLVRALAVTGDLEQARRYRAEAVTGAGGDPVLVARTVGAFDVPAIWTTNDDEALSARLAEAAERALAALPPGHDAERARLLVTIAVERRGDRGGRGREAAREAEALARRLDDPSLLAMALNGRFLHTCHRAGLAPRRALIGDELLALASRHGLVPFEVLGHLVLVQSRTASADLASADHHAAAADALAERHDLPLVGVFTTWYRALRLAVTGRRDEARAAYRAAASRLAGAGMPGVERGLLPLALLSLGDAGDGDPGPYAPWVRPLGAPAPGEPAAVPDPPHDLMLEARTCLHAVLAVEAGDRATAALLYDRLLPAAGELAGGSGLVAFGPVDRYLAALADLLGHHDRAAGHRRRAEGVAAALGAPQWTPLDRRR
ncbi:BTAD domain-containing putative transcriptional regulator [Actinosynnema sp. NPDC053489]|uniref:BTAD domain-containing putative transcriptional regulator n=1 Tax=Actinosynnema sp. NPDC053489 TaxID=3363916 RepID=UPI0037C6A454